MQHKPLSKHGNVVTWKMSRFIDPLWGMQSFDVIFNVSLNTLLTNCRVVGDLRRHIACVMSHIYREYWHISILLIDKHSLFIYIYIYKYIYIHLIPHLPHSTIFILNIFHGVITHWDISCVITLGLIPKGLTGEKSVLAQFDDAFASSNKETLL